MNPETGRWMARWNRILHRDLGYLITAFVISYSLSGIALNHIKAWNPDFVIHRREITLPAGYRAQDIQGPVALALGAQVGEPDYRIIDSPAEDLVKIYYEHATLHLDLAEGRGRYERVARRPLFFDLNVLHRNSAAIWRWFADGFSVLLILVNLTGLFILKGRNGLSGRGVWLMAAGAVPPLVVTLLFRAA